MSSDEALTDGSDEATARERPRPSLVSWMVRSPLFASLPPAILTQLAERLVRRELAVGAELLGGAEEPAGLFIVESGRLATVVRNVQAGTVQVVATLGAGQAFGASALVLRAPPAAD